MPDDAENIFNDPVSIVWFYFLESQLKVCCNTIKNRKWHCFKQWSSWRAGYFSK
jgi:hypothetical protein